jgi:predicted DNA-binding transcriptional regulator AlpA
MAAAALAAAPAAPNPAAGLPDRPTYNTADLAAYFRVSRDRVRAWYREGRLPQPVLVARTLRWPREVIEAWIRSGGGRPE